MMKVAEMMRVDVYAHQPGHGRVLGGTRAWHGRAGAKWTSIAAGRP